MDQIGFDSPESADEKGETVHETVGKVNRLLRHESGLQAQRRRNISMSLKQTLNIYLKIAVKRQLTPEKVMRSVLCAYLREDGCPSD
jgi:hypothetical protein